MVLREPHIIVFENLEEFGYHLMESEHNVPFYIPDDNIEFEKGVNSDSVIFLPLDEKTFKRDRKNRYVGFRLRFDSSEHSTFVFGVDPNALSWTDIQITTSVRRFLYTIDRSERIVIHEVRDPMVPPTIGHFRAPSELIGAAVLSFTETQIDSYGSWFLSNKV